MNWGIKVLQTSALPLGYGAEINKPQKIHLPISPCGLLSGAGYEIRTRDFHLGKVTLYH